METETPTRGAAQLTAGPRPDTFTITVRGRHVHLCRESLEAVVQQAYDAHDILATPSYATEAGR